MENVVIIGTGCAGLTSAIYTARANLEPLVIEGDLAGGQLGTTTDVENYPGFPEGIMGPVLTDNMRQQATRFGARVERGYVTEVKADTTPFQLVIDEGERTIEAKTVIMSAGASPRYLGLESERQLLGYGLSSCATCDGAFFRDQEVAVVGGGDTAMEDSLFLTRFASKVTIIHRRDELRASQIMRERAFENEKIEFLWDTVVTDVSDVEKKEVTGVQIQNVKTQAESFFDCQGVFIAIGHVPNTKIFDGILDLDDEGYIQVQHPTTATNIPGIFACGDCVDHIYRQAVTAAGTGCSAAIDAERYLAEHE
ncbi:MAG: thioredoxin-disulfide reductase [bacterium]|nr:thioredoxin-disulfide reductase [bacterium]